MKRHLLILTLFTGVLLTSCDPMEEDLRLADSQTEDEAARKGKYSNITLKRGYKIYELTEMTYLKLMEEEMTGEAEITLKHSAGNREQFLREMIRSSMEAFGEVTATNGGFLSPAAKRSISAMMAAGWDLQFDPDLGTKIDGFLKVPDIPAPPAGDAYYIVPEGVDDPSLRISVRELVELTKFLDVLPRYLNDPVALEEALNELDVLYGLNEVKIGLLLPAVQKVREAASSGFRGGVNVAAGDVNGFYELDPENLPRFFQFAGYGSITALINLSHTSGDGDTDGRDFLIWQRQGTMFEMEMWLLWDGYWNKYASDPTTGR